MTNRHPLAVLFGLLCLAVPWPAQAHDPIFGLGSHTLFKGGIEVTPSFASSQAGSTREQEFAFEAAYDVTADWTDGVDGPGVAVIDPSLAADARIAALQAWLLDEAAESD